MKIGLLKYTTLAQTWINYTTKYITKKIKCVKKGQGNKKKTDKSPKIGKKKEKK